MYKINSQKSKKCW